MSISRIQPGPRMSQAVSYGKTLYLAGQIADSHTASLEVQTTEVLSKIGALLDAAGAKKSDLLSVHVLLADMADFAAMNAVYDQWLDKENPPARACFEAKLAFASLKVEIVAICALP